jgi:hypothetical protein
LILGNAAGSTLEILAEGVNPFYLRAAERDERGTLRPRAIA